MLYSFNRGAAFAPLVCSRTSVKVRKLLKLKPKGFFFGPNPSEHIRCNPGIGGGIIGGIYTSIENVPPK